MKEMVFALYIVCTHSPSEMCKEGSAFDAMSFCQEAIDWYRVKRIAAECREEPLEEQYRALELDN